MLPVVNWSDPRLQPLAYVANKKLLYEVLEVDRTKGVLVENCLDGSRLRVGPREVVPGWRLVRAAPDASDVEVAA